MNIYIKHINNTFNYGSCMMAITLISKLNKKIDNINFYVDTMNDINLFRLQKETGINNIYKDYIDGDKNIIKRINNKLKRIRLKRILANVDAIIVIGGDDISEYYGVEALEVELKRLEEESKTKNVILLGQTIGPFTEGRAELARKSLSKTKIYTRDENCYKYLKEIGFNNIFKGRDLAFLELPKQQEARYILDKYNLSCNKYITLVMSGLWKSYTNNYDNYIQEYLNIILDLANKEYLKEKKIVLLPHVLIPKHVDDRLIIKDIKSKLDEEVKSKIVFIEDEMLPSEAREILGNGIFTITGRMHAAVSTFFMRKPAISLSYSVKYSGVIGDGLDMNDLVIESAYDEMWESKEISKQVNKKVEYIINNYDKLINKINNNVKEVTKITNFQLDNLVEDISI